MTESSTIENNRQYNYLLGSLTLYCFLIISLGSWPSKCSRIHHPSSHHYQVFFGITLFLCRKIFLSSVCLSSLSLALSFFNPFLALPLFIICILCPLQASDRIVGVLTGQCVAQEAPHAVLCTRIRAPQPPHSFQGNSFSGLLGHEGEEFNIEK